MSEYDIDMNIYLLPIIFLLSTAQPFVLFLYFFKRRDIEWKIYRAVLLTSMAIYPILAIYALHTYFKSTFFTYINPWAWIEIAGLLLLSSIASLVAALLIQALMKVIPETDSLAFSRKKIDARPVFRKTITVSISILAITGLAFIFYSSFSKAMVLSKQERAHLNCLSISDKNEQYRCFGELFTSTSECEDFIKSISNKGGSNPHSTDFCSSTLAIKRNDPALCRTSRGRFRVGVCLSELASFKNEPSICDHALKFLSNEEKSREEKEICLQRVAYSTSEYKVCEQITDEEIFKECIVGVAVKRGDKERCMKLEDESYRNYCLSYLPKT